MAFVIESRHSFLPKGLLMGPECGLLLSSKGSEVYSTGPCSEGGL